MLSKRPNFVFIFADDWGWGDIGPGSRLAGKVTYRWPGMSKEEIANDISS